MSDRRAGDRVEGAASDGGLVLNFRDMGWTGRLAWYLRAMACLWMFKGLYHWAAVCGIIGIEGGFEAHVQSWQATTAYFAVIDLVAAVGLWLMAPWGVVVWLTSAVSMIVVHIFFDQVYGTDIMVVGVGVAVILGYLGLSILAAQEHPR